MFRGLGFLPFILAVIGLPVFFFNSIDPLFEWQINQVTLDVPSSYETRVAPSPWKARCGDSLGNKSYIFQKIYISDNGKACSTRDLNFVVKRSQSDTLLERISLIPQLNLDTLKVVLWWILIEIALSLAYMWFSYWTDAHPGFGATIPVLATICFCFIIPLTMRAIGPRIGSFEGNAQCHGTITLSAQLLKVHYSVAILVFTGLFAEVAALAMMVHQVVSVASKGRESSKPAVG